MPANIAIVDDEAEVIEVLRRGIELDKEYVCRGRYRCARDALKGIPEGRFDAVLMDIRMPEVSGIECTRALRAILPEIRVIVLTGLADDATIFESLRAGAIGYLLKPVTIPECRKAIGEVLRGGAPLCGEAGRILLEIFREAAPARPQPLPLSPRESEIMACLMHGMQSKEVAASLGIGTGTVNTHMHRMFEKLQVGDRRGAIAKYRESMED